MKDTTKQPGTNLDPNSLRVRDKRGRYRYVRLRWRVLFAVIDALGWLLFWPAYLWRKLVRHGSISPRRIRTILVIQLDHFGDAILSTGLLQWIKQRFPTASLEVLTSKWNQEFFQQLTLVDQVHVLAETRFARAGNWRWVRALIVHSWQLRRRQFDLAVDVRGEFPHAVAMWLAGAVNRVGWSAGGGGFLLTHSTPFVPQRHEVASRAEIASLISAKPIPPEDVAPQVTAPSQSSIGEFVSSNSQSQTLLATTVSPRTISRGAIALHIGAGTAAKIWPAESWASLALELIARETTRQVVLLGGPSERDLAEAVLLQCHVAANSDVHISGAHRLMNLAGQMSLMELTHVLQQCSVLVGADSGPAHLASACGTPVVVLYSGTNHPEQWRPWGDQVSVVKHPVACAPCHLETCPLPDHPCMQGIKPRQVAGVIDGVLEAERKRDVRQSVEITGHVVNRPIARRV
ncbi:MAG: glycosyltransferase family 9 protein [Pirellulales bacterium]|nr:glycosyltransferase family 9 protein [Pirellulales bacterium]